MIRFGNLIDQLMLGPHLFLPHAPIEQQQFEITNRPHYHLCLHCQPTMNLILNIFEDLVVDLMKLHS
jgi:hypothetical protein